MQLSSKDDHWYRLFVDLWFRSLTNIPFKRKEDIPMNSPLLPNFYMLVCPLCSRALSVEAVFYIYEDQIYCVNKLWQPGHLGLTVNLWNVRFHDDVAIQSSTLTFSWLTTMPYERPNLYASRSWNYACIPTYTHRINVNVIVCVIFRPTLASDHSSDASLAFAFFFLVDIPRSSFTQQIDDQCATWQ